MFELERWRHEDQVDRTCGRARIQDDGRHQDWRAHVAMPGNHGRFSSNRPHLDHLRDTANVANIGRNSLVRVRNSMGQIEEKQATSVASGEVRVHVVLSNL